MFRISTIIVIAVMAIFSATAQVPFTTRMQWVGPYDIKMVASVNLQPVFLDSSLTVSGNLYATSIITDQTISMSGTLLNINNRYKGGNPFINVAVPLPALVCKDAQAPCFEGYKLTTPTATCPERYDLPSTVNKYISMTYADYDKDNTTFSSSMAQLDMPSCSTIESAYLYWTGNFKGAAPGITLKSSSLNSYTGPQDVFNVTSSLNNYKAIKFKVPGSQYQIVTAAQTYTDEYRYVNVADVTNLAKFSAGGQYWAANIMSYPNEGGGGSASGWVLVVVIKSPNSPPRRISLLDGLVSISSNSVPASLDITLNGIQSPVVTNARSYVGYAALDGENIANLISGAVPEGIGFKTNGGAIVEINPLCFEQPPVRQWTKKGYPQKADESDNIDLCKKPLFDNNWLQACDGISSSKITSYNEITAHNGNEIVRLPSGRNTLGFDAHHLRLPDNAIAPNATQATLTIKSGAQGALIPFLAYIATEQLQPKLGLTKIVDKDQTTTGSELTYTLKIVNEGNQDSFGNDVLIDTLDPVTKYMSGSATSVKYVLGSSSAGNVAAPVVTQYNTSQIVKFTIPAIKRNDSLKITFKVNVLPVTDPVAGPLYNDQCKRLIYNVAWIEYKKNLAEERLKIKSNSGDCLDSYETRIRIVDASLEPPAVVLGPYDASAYKSEFIIKHVRKKLFESGSLAASDTAKALVYDESGNRIFSFDAFPLNSCKLTYYAYADIIGANCVKKFSVSFTFGCISTGFESAEENSDITVSIVPQPLSDVSIVHINSLNSSEKFTVGIFTLNGSMVKSFSCQGQGNAELNKSDFVSGIYLIKISDQSGKVWNKKLVVK